MRVTEKGQVTIPKNVRSNLGIEPGSDVEFLLKGREAVLRRVEPAEALVERSIQEFTDHLNRHKGSMNLGGMDGDEFYRLLRD